MSANIRIIATITSLFLTAWSLLVSNSTVAQPQTSNPVIVATLDGAIGPASEDHLARILSQAQQSNAQLLVLQLNTPGGLDSAMRTMVADILASPVPVVTWVTPSGARAASAGTYILMASHVAAMAPATNTGSSTPVAGGGGGTDLDEKIIEDAASYLEGLAELRGRNTEWARRTVTDADNLTASAALAEGVIDLIAESLSELLAALDGRTLEAAGASVTLNLADPTIIAMDTNWRHQFLSIITNPNIAYILLMLGIYGLIFEFYSPGLGVGGVTGLICLLVAAYALQMLPVSYAGLALLVLGIGLIAFEALSPSFGLFGLAGLVAFVLGSVMLIDSDDPAWRVSLALIAALAVSTAALVIFVLGAAIRARHRPVVSGVESMAGQLAMAREDFDHVGHVTLNGEIWQAETSTPVKHHQPLRVIGIKGLTLKVEPADKE